MRQRTNSRRTGTSTERGGRWPWRSGPDRDRAQLILVSALVLATTLVALSLVVNSVIYTENLATRRDADTGGALNFQTTSKSNAIESLETANFGTDDQTYLQRKEVLRDSLADWKRSSSRFFAREGLEVDLNARAFVEGTRVSHDTVGTFDPATDDVFYENNALDPLGIGVHDTWLAVQAADLRRFRMDVERSGPLYETSTNPISASIQTLYDGNDVYSLNVEDADGDRWWVVVYEDNSTSPSKVGVATYEVERDESFTSGEWTTSDPCLVDADTVTIDVTGGTVQGDGTAVDCPALAFFDDEAFEGPINVTHTHGDSISGTYSFVADRPVDEFRSAIEARNNGDLYDDIEDYAVNVLGIVAPTVTADDSYHATSGGGDPYTDTAIYAIDIDARYETADIAYHSSARVAPGEPTPAKPTDTGAWGSGGDNAPPDAEYTVDTGTVVVGDPITVDASWSSDADGSIQRYEWSFGDGSTARGSTETYSYSSTGTYEVRLTVTDDDGATASRTRTIHVVSSDADPPVVDSVGLTDTSSSGSDADTVEYEVDWTVSDDTDSAPYDGDLSEVRVRLVADPGGERSVVDSAIATVDGDTATSTLTVGGRIVGGCGAAYEVVVTVEDDTGMTDSDSRGVTASC